MGLREACVGITFAVPVLLVVLQRFVYEVRPALHRHLGHMLLVE